MPELNVDIKEGSNRFTMTSPKSGRSLRLGNFTTSDKKYNMKRFIAVVERKPGFITIKVIELDENKFTR